jgi:hypothetical protein
MLATSFHDIAVLRELSLDAWKSVFTAAGEPARAATSYEDLWRSLTTDAPGEELQDALEVIHELGTDAGRELLTSAANDQQVPLGAIDDEPARELAARIWRESRTSEPLAEVLSRAQFTAHQAANPREYREYVGEGSAGTRGKPASELDTERVREAVATWCRENAKAEPVDVYAYESGGEWRCEILRGEAARRVLEIRKDLKIKKDRPRILDFRPGVADHLRYDPETGRLGIATRSPKLAQMYRRLIGSIVADSDSFFSSANICTLRPLQEHGGALFERNRPPGIIRVDVTELRWRRGDREKVWVKGPDCFRLLEDLGAKLDEGELIEARLSIWFAGATQRGVVTIKVPGRIEIRAGAKEPLVERLLDQVGIRGVFEVDATRRDLWSLYPWRHDEQAWRRHVGADFDRLLKASVLRPVSLQAVTHPDHPDAVGALDVEVIDGKGTTVGYPDDAAIALRTLTPSDVAGYELDVGTLATQIAGALELAGDRDDLGNGLWQLGRRTLSSSATVAVFLATREPGTTAAQSLRATANGASPVLLVPAGRSCTAEMQQVQCRVPAGPYDELLGNIVDALGLQEQVPPFLYLSHDLILDPKSGSAWYRRVPLSKLLPGTHPYKFAEMVVRANGQPVTKDALHEYLSAHNPDEGIVRKAKSDFVKFVKASYAAAGREEPADAKEIFAARSGGYVLRVTARVL